jgi:putative transposase
LNAYAERWVRSAKEECLSEIILFGERSLRRALSEYVAHYHAERNHQGKSNVLLFPLVSGNRREVSVQCRERFCVSTIERLREWVGKSRTISLKAV